MVTRLARGSQRSRQPFAVTDLRIDHFISLVHQTASFFDVVAARGAKGGS